MKSAKGMSRLVALLIAAAALAVSAGAASAGDGKRGDKGDGERSSQDQSQQSRSHDRDGDHNGDRGSDGTSAARSDDGDDDHEGERRSQERSKSYPKRSHERAKVQGASCSNPCASKDHEGERSSRDRSKSYSKRSHERAKVQGASCSTPCASKDDDERSERKSREKSKQKVAGATTPGYLPYCYRDASGEWKLGYAPARELAKKVASENVIAPPFQLEGKWHSKRWDSEGQAILAECKSKKSKAVAKPSGSFKATSRGEDRKRGKLHKQTLCHATGSATNPYVVITPSVSGAYHGHLAHQDSGDIVPPFTYKGTTYSQNWDAAGQALFANGCAAVAARESQPPAPAAPLATAATPAPAPAPALAPALAPAPAPAAAPAAAPAPATPANAPAAAVAAATKAPAAVTAPAAVAPASEELAAAAPPSAAEEQAAGGVLGATASAPQQNAETGTAATLPFTGIPLWVATLFGIALLGTGLALRRGAHR